jgi:cytochrome subunit of sulfide dehydrogenase
MNTTSWTPARRRAGSLLAASVLAGLAAAPAAAQGSDRQARVWAATCVTCHGTGGLAQQAGIPPITGRDADQMLRTLLEFKNGQRPAATVMHQHAKGYTDEELKRIAQFFSTAAGQ